MSFIVARLKARGVPKARQRPVAAGQNFEVGALLVLDGSGNWAECGADPAAIGAVSESPFGVDTVGYIGTGRKEFPPGEVVATAVQDEVSFKAQYLGSLPAAIGGTYGVTRDTGGIWKVDFNKTGATARVKLLNRFADAPINQALVEVVFLSANVQIV